MNQYNNIQPQDFHINKSKLPTHIELDEKYGLSKESVILLEQVRTIDKARLKEKMGCLDNDSMGLVDKALSVSFGLNVNSIGFTT